MTVANYGPSVHQEWASIISTSPWDGWMQIRKRLRIEEYPHPPKSQGKGWKPNVFPMESRTGEA